jgi:hypothetical protein
MGDSYYPAAYGGGRLDFSGIESLGDSIGGAITNRMDQGRYRDAFAQATGPDGSVDYNKLTAILGGMGDMAGAAKATTIGNNNNDKFFGTPIWGVDSTTGKEGIGAFTKNGRFEVLDTGGFQPTRGVTIEDYGTYRQPQSKATGAPVGQGTNIDIVGRESAEKQGAIAGENIGTLPSAAAQTEESIKTINQAISHPGRETATGKSGAFDPRSYVPGTESKSYQVGPYQQVRGQAFLGNIQQMRGLGHLSDAEGMAATAAATSLNTAQTDEDHLRSLHDLKALQLRGLIRAYDKAGKEIPEDIQGEWAAAEAQSGIGKKIPFQAGRNQGLVAPATQPGELPVYGQPQSQTGPQGAPTKEPLAPGMVVGGFRFKGGNPNDPNAWERAQ